MTEKRKFYLSKKGLEKLQQEYEETKKLRAEKFKDGVPQVWESQDLSPEYVSFKEEVNLLEKKLVEVEQVLGNYILISPPEDKNVVDFGAIVILVEKGRKVKFEIVDPLEANPALGKISADSPIGKSLFKKKVGDICSTNPPLGNRYKILRIRYRNS